MTQVRKIREEHLKEAESRADELVLEPYACAKQALGLSQMQSSAGLEVYKRCLREEIKAALAIQIGLPATTKEVIKEEEDDIAERLKHYEDVLKNSMKERKPQDIDPDLERFSLLVGYGVSYMLVSKEIDKATISKFDERLKLSMALPKNLDEALKKEKSSIKQIIDFLEDQEMVKTEQDKDSVVLYAKYRLSKQRYEMQKALDFKEYKDMNIQLNSYTINNLQIEDKDGKKVGEEKEALDIEEVQWEDVIGQEDAKKMMRDTVVRFLGTYDRATKKSIFENVLATRPPKAILLFGPPGTGKSLTVKAALTEAEQIRKSYKDEKSIHYKIITAADIKNKYVGESAKAIQEVFTTAKKEAPSLIIIDELDAFFSKRQENGFNEGDREISSIIMQELDGIKKSEGYIVVGITNMPKALDKAITSRFDTRIEYKNPKDEKEVIALFKVHFRRLIEAKGLPEFKDTEWEKVGDTGMKQRFTGRLVKQFAEKIERERNDYLTTLYKNNKELIEKYNKDPESIKKAMDKHSRGLTCDLICQKMVDFGQAMHMSENYSFINL